MSLFVTLNIYSGRTDPSWLLSEDKAREFWSQIHALQIHTPLKAVDPYNRLGYRGFTVLDLSRTPFSSIRLLDGIVDLTRDAMSLVDPDRSIELWLLDSAPHGLVEPEVRKVAEEEFLPDVRDLIESKHLRFVPKSHACIKLADDAPKFEPRIWNASGIRENNNCYGYANDKPIGMSAVPGRSKNSTNAPHTCTELIQGAEADGLTFLGYAGAVTLVPRVAGQGWYVAVATSTRMNDFHFLRQDDDGCWSHKIAKGYANRLGDIAEIGAGPYRIYNVCAYMVTNRSVKIAG